MPKILWKSLHLCFPSNLTKCYSSPCLPPSAAAADEEDPSRPSIVLINNFNLLYHDDDDDNNRNHRVADLPSSSTTTTATTSSSTATSSTESENHDILSAAFASRRFFFSSPGRSNAITDSPETRSRELSDNYENATTSRKKKKNYDATSVNNNNTTRLLSGGTAVKQHVYSPDPLTDFRRSMQEMIDAAIVDGELSHPDDDDDDGYDFLNELLLSYLSLNPTDTHKFVIRAFSDILVSLLSEERRIC
ncbi:hypothetical protein EUTSA_v10017153mg [Eutrema salsugineum]|uniref:Transcription repressor n=1 Tax=Eutrema salsugineum TaxID=72664 RepID=V4LMK7_EUTSA|nr:transcription repressor OFP16 [Eutrema salsugineum]ESQ51800.1 hypothetical protein EUTSA_v10017153mg [Eutrema salsugineum]